jgi:hypothetical protein
MVADVAGFFLTAVAGFFLTAAEHPTQQKERQTP